MRGSTWAGGEAAAAAELAEKVRQPDAVVVLVFASPRYQGDALAAELQEWFAPTPVVGCTTAGEIGPGGFGEGSAVAMSLAGGGLRVGIGVAGDLGQSAFRGGASALHDAAAEIGMEPGELPAGRCVGITLIDGRSGQEETFIAGVASAARGVPLVGGSASDDVDGPPKARTFHRGRAGAGCGMVVLFDSPAPFLAFKSEHMRPTERKVVVTGADQGARLVNELDGRPALEVFRDCFGLGDVAIDSDLAGRHPFATYVGGRAYVRSVMAVEDGSLRFACAVDKGVVLRPMLPHDLVGDTDVDLRAAEKQLGGIRALIAFHCLGRYLESKAMGTTEALGEVLARYPVVGFNTFGEQYNALHVNHTLTGLAFGERSDG